MTNLYIHLNEIQINNEIIFYLLNKKISLSHSIKLSLIDNSWVYYYLLSNILKLYWFKCLIQIEFNIDQWLSHIYSIKTSTCFDNNDFYQSYIDSKHMNWFIYEIHYSKIENDDRWDLYDIQSWFWLYVKEYKWWKIFSSICYIFFQYSMKTCFMKRKFQKWFIFILTLKYKFDFHKFLSIFLSMIILKNFHVFHFDIIYNTIIQFITSDFV